MIKRISLLSIYFAFCGRFVLASTSFSIKSTYDLYDAKQHIDVVDQQKAAKRSNERILKSKKSKIAMASIAVPLAMGALWCLVHTQVSPKFEKYEETAVNLNDDEGKPIPLDVYGEFEVKPRQIGQTCGAASIARALQRIYDKPENETGKFCEEKFAEWSAYGTPPLFLKKFYEVGMNIDVVQRIIDYENNKLPFSHQIIFHYEYIAPNSLSMLKLGLVNVVHLIMWSNGHYLHYEVSRSKPGSSTWFHIVCEDTADKYPGRVNGAQMLYKELNLLQDSNVALVIRRENQRLKKYKQQVYLHNGEFGKTLKDYISCNLGLDVDVINIITPAGENCYLKHSITRKNIGSRNENIVNCDPNHNNIECKIHSKLQELLKQ